MQILPWACVPCSQRHESLGRARELPGACSKHCEAWRARLPPHAAQATPTSARNALRTPWLPRRYVESKQGRMHAIFSRLDLDGDGRLDAREVHHAAAGVWGARVAGEGA